MTQTLAFIDIETTGLDVTRHEIIEIGVVLVDASLQNQDTYTILDTFHFKIRPMHITQADPQALRINHYDPSQWQEAITLQEALVQLSEKTKGAVMVGHHVAFDLMFLDRAFKETGVANMMHYHVLDTVSLAYSKLPEYREDISRYGLQYLCDHFKIKNKESHTARADAYATFELYKKLLAL